MSFSGGVFTINSSGQPVVSGTTISSTVFNALTADLATGLSTCVLKDGTQTVTALVPFAFGLDISAATGGQVKFPATQNPSSNANTLDDYEEGTFTPSITFGGAAVGMTFSRQVGFYTKIGNRVIMNGVIQLSAKGSSTGAAIITALPFTNNSTTNNECPVTVRPANLNVTPVQVVAYIAPNTTTIVLENLGVAAFADTDFTNTTYFSFAASFYV